MSHITQVEEIQVSDLPAFEKACRERGVELRRDQKQFKNFGGRNSPCEMAVVDPQNRKAYEAGLVKTADGKAYVLQVDNWNEGHGLNEKIGYNAGLLLQRYGINAAKNAAVKQGMAVREALQADGSIKLICEPRQVLAGAGYGSGF